MKLVAVAVLSLVLVGCTDRKAGEDDESTGTGTGNAEDPTNAMSDPTPTTGEPDNPAGFCKPVAQAPEACPQDYICCSDDPATTQGRLPNYFNPGKVDDKYGVPIFSSNNNVLSYSGQCVDIGGFASPLANGCPVPCNPTWAEAQQAEICGVGSTCCPFQVVDPNKDCVIDPVTNEWRAVRGSDIPMLTTWGSSHTTNQDPQGKSCTLFASPGGMLDQEALADCYMQLSVADQRGFCYAKEQCECHEDLCGQKNPGYVLRCK